MNNYNQLAQQLIDAIKQSLSGTLDNIDVQRENTFEGIMNQANARGNLYSTAPAYLQNQQDAQFAQQKADVRQKSLTQEISIKSGLLDTQRQIDATKRAAADLNSITFDALLT